MHKIQSMLGCIATLLVVIVLVVVSFWLVGRQAQPGSQPTTQDTNRPTPPPATPQPTIPPTPLPTETPTVPPTATTSPSPTHTPFTPQVIFGKGSLVTLEPPPVLSPTPTPTFEPLTGQAIGGYVFSQAQLVPGTAGSYIDLIEWLPDDPHKLLLVRDDKSLEVIDITTGDTQLYSNGATRVRNPVWLPGRQAVAYLTFDEQDRTKQYLWISEGGPDQMTATANQPVLTTAWVPPLVTTPDGNGVILFDATWQLTQIGSLNAQSVKLATDTKDYAPTGYGHDQIYQVVQSPDKNKAVYFNYNRLLLADFTTGNLTPIDLTRSRTEKISPGDNVYYAAWNPAGDKLALNIATGKRKSDLFILDLLSDHLNFIDNGFQHVGELIWTPDGEHILDFRSYATQDDGYGQAGLFLVNPVSTTVQPIAALPPAAVIASLKSILWSPDGNHLAVVIADEPGNPGLYVIDVEKP